MFDGAFKIWFKFVTNKNKFITLTYVGFGSLNMSPEFAEKCVEKVLSMKEIVQISFNYLHDTNLLFDVVSSSKNPKKNKKSTPMLRKEGFEFLSNLGLLKKSTGKCSTCNVDYKLITPKNRRWVVVEIHQMQSKKEEYQE